MSSNVLPIGAGGGLLAGLALIVAGLVTALSADPFPGPLYVSMWLVGLASMLSSFFALRRSRVAWAFATSINGTVAVVLLFAAPRIRDTFDLALITAALPAVALVVVTSLLAVSSPELESDES